MKKRLDAGEPIKFTFRVNDNKGPSYELNSESKRLEGRELRPA